MGSLEQRILTILMAEKEPLSVSTLITRIIADDESARESQIRAALFPLMSTSQVDLSLDGTVKYIGTKELATAGN